MLAMDTLSYLEEPLTHRMKVERNLNFATLPNDEDDFGFSRKKTARDPMSHRIIEKRRRDRMNNCLADLSRLVPTNYLKKGRGRIEKTEIIEMAIKHLKHLQAHPCKDPGSCEVAKATEQDHKRQFRQGYQECMSETMKFMMEVEGSWIGDGVGIRLINHLQKHYDKLSGGLCYTQALNLMASEESKSAVLHMDVDNHSSSCFPPETNGAVLHTEHNGNHPPPPPVNHYYEGSGRVGGNHHTEVAPQLPELKHEADTNGHHHHHLDATSNHNQQQQPPTSKVTSQLREMLQNPGLPKDHSRCPSSPNHHHNHQQVSPASSAASNHSHYDSSSKGEEGCYKFKNNIKHRFNADLRHHTSSPTDSSHLSDEEKPLQTISSEDRPPVPAPPVLLCGGSASSFSPYAASELSAQAHWDSHVETASSCGSNPSPPPNAGGGGGSSSGYSTNGDTSHRVGGKGGGPSPHSPALSPSGSPQPGVVPVFALHPKGTFYIPLTVEASLLVPYMVGLIDETSPPVLHPVSICVNLGAHSVKVGGHHHHNPFQPRPFLMDKFHHDRFVYSDRHLFYSGSPPPTKNGCA